jgi:hypothetical protein
MVIWKTYVLYRTTKDSFARALALGFLGGLFGLMMSNMFGSRLDSQEVSGYFWILTALILRLRILDEREGNFGSMAKPFKKLDTIWRTESVIHPAESVKS